uniref:Uncharacterized protein n=1 Tax=Avena sativa TaxID=4498 RepID=A0ACD5UYS7_AVESA
MAVQAQHVSRAFHHELHSYRALQDRATGASLFSDELGGCAPAMAGTGTTMLNDVPRSDLTCNDNNYNSASVPRKRARGGGGGGGVWFHGRTAAVNNNHCMRVYGVVFE